MADAYYNDNDPPACAWLRELIAQGHLPPGDVDERGIEDVGPDELVRYRQAHWFSGIGGWPYALSLAGWPEDRPVWTGSCPCQPYSAAGKGGGDDDPRALWWAWRWLIEQRRPAVVFGEQVASKAGRAWFAGVRADLEGMGYAVGAADLCAAGVGAPHIRQRLWWVADTGSAAGWTRTEHRTDDCGKNGIGSQGANRAAQHSPTGRLADSGSLRRSRGRLDHCGAEEGGRAEATERHELRVAAAAPSADLWDRAIWIPCADGKARRIEPGLEPLVDGLPGRVGLLRGYGNSIVPQVAATFVRAYMGSHP